MSVQTRSNIRERCNWCAKQPVFIYALRKPSECARAPNERRRRDLHISIFVKCLLPPCFTATTPPRSHCIKMMLWVVVSNSRMRIQFCRYLISSVVASHCAPLSTLSLALVDIFLCAYKTNYYESNMLTPFWIILLDISIYTVSIGLCGTLPDK